MRRACQLMVLGLSSVFIQTAAAAQISFYTAVDLALRNSPQVRMGIADVQRAAAGVSVAVDAYKPDLVLGSSLGFSYGFPLGQPEVFSLSTQSLAFSFSQPDYIRAARKSLEAARLQLEDTQQEIILSTAIDYIELAKVERQMTALDQENGDAQKLIQIEDDRVSAGYDSRVDLTEARLTGAQIALKRLHLMDQAAILRQELAHLTGLRPTDISPEPQTIPPTPPAEQAADDMDSTVMRANSGIQAAYASAKSKLYTAFGDSRQNNRPTISFVASYGLFSNFNNYAEYYLHFQENNFGGGIQINIPFLDAALKAKSRASNADAVHAFAQADQQLDHASEQVLQLQKNVAELAAEEQVAELQNELAQDQLEAVTTQLQSGSGGANGTPLTPKDEQQARIHERNQFINMLDAQFQLTQARLSLLRSLGQIGDWAKAAPKGAPEAAP